MIEYFHSFGLSGLSVCREGISPPSPAAVAAWRGAGLPIRGARQPPHGEQPAPAPPQGILATQVPPCGYARRSASRPGVEPPRGFPSLGLSRTVSRHRGKLPPNRLPAAVPPRQRQRLYCPVCTSRINVSISGTCVAARASSTAFARSYGRVISRMSSGASGSLSAPSKIA